MEARTEYTCLWKASQPVACTVAFRNTNVSFSYNVAMFYFLEICSLQSTDKTHTQGIQFYTKVLSEKLLVGYVAIVETPMQG